MRLFLSTLSAALVIVVPAIVNAGTRPGTWPTYAHDFQRSGRADGKGEMTKPTVAWTERLGANLASNAAVFADLDGDGRTDIAAISGGHVVASNAAGSTLWTGPLDAPQELLGVWNLDGANAPEIVVQLTGGVEILDGGSGKVDVILPDTGSLAATFVPLGSTGGILVVAGAKGTIDAYDFRGNIAPNSPRWSLANDDNPMSFLVGDVDGDSTPDLVRPLDNGFEVLDPLSGNIKYGPLTLDSTAFGYLVELADLDGVAGVEIVAIDYSYIYSPAAGIYALGIRNNALQVLWKSTVNATLSLATDFYTISGSARDLDNDGKVEVVYSQWDDGKATWTTYVVDGATGSAISSVSGLVQAIDDIDGDGKLEVLIRDTPAADKTPTRTALRTYDFDSRNTGLTVKQWSVAASRVVMVGVTQPNGTSVGLSAPIVGDFDPNAAGTEVLIASDTSNAKADTQFATLRADGSLASTQSIALESTLAALWQSDNLTSTSSKNDLVMFSNDGTVHVETRSLTQGASFDAGSYATPFYVAALSTTQPAVFAQTSTNGLRWLDGTHLHTTGDPYVLTTINDTVPSAAWGIGGWAFDPVVPLDATAPVFAVYEQRDGEVSIVALDTSGIEVWRTALATGTQILPPGAYVNDYTGDGIPDVLVTLNNVHSLESLALFDGLDGHIVRSTPLASIEASADYLAQGSLVDVNGDGVLDLVGQIQSRGTVAIDVSGDPMTALWLIPNGSYNMGTIGVGAFGGLTEDLFRAGGDDGYGSYARIATNGTILSSQDEGTAALLGDDRNHAVLVTRGNGPSFDLVSVGMAEPVLSRVMRIAGDTLAPVWTVYAANGALTTTAPTTVYALHDPAEVDVDGDGVEDVVFGSDDGYVYAVRSTDGTLVFAVNLGVPANFVVAADIDNDPALELVVGLADGRLVALDEPGKYHANIDDGDGGTPDGGQDGGAGNSEGGCPTTPTQPSQPNQGGCGCNLPEQSTPAGGFLATLLVVGLFIVRRRPQIS